MMRKQQALKMSSIFIICIAASGKKFNLFDTWDSKN